MLRLSLFPRYLGADFAALPAPVQAAHQVEAGLVLTGRARVSRGRGVWPRLIAAVFGFPAASEDVSVTVVMTPQRGGERWVRQFGQRRFTSYLAVQKGAMTERFGPLTFRLGLHVADEALHFPVSCGRLGWLALPRALLPISKAKEFARGGRFHFDVALHAPLTGALILRYEGWLVPAAAPSDDEVPID